MSFNDKLATFFRNHPNEWVDGKVLAEFAGSYAWRSRISDLRFGPYFMLIDNRQVHHTRGTAKWVTSEYRYVPPQPVDTPGDAADLNTPWTLQ